MNEELKIIISAEVEKLKKGVEDAKKHMQGFKDQVKEASKNADDNIKKMGEGIKNGLKVVGTTIAAAGTALLALAASTTEYRQNQAQLNAAFEQAGLSAESAKGAYTELYKVIGDDDQAVESAANIAMLADSEKEAAQWAELASGVLGTFHDTLQPEAFYEAANETLKLGEATGAFTQMLEQTGVMSVEEFNKGLAECSTEAEKQAFMLEVSKKAMGEAGAQYDKATANIQKQREAQAKLNENTAKLGEALAPVITAFTSFASDALALVVPYIQSLAEQYMPKLKELLDGVATGLENAFTWASQHKTLLEGLAIALGVIVTAIGLYNAVAAIKAAMAAAEVATVWGLVAAYTAQAAATLLALAPYILIAAAIAAVIAVIVLCIKHWDDIKKTVVNVAKAMWEKIKEAIDKITTFFEDLRSKVQSKVEAVKEAIAEKFNTIKTNMQEKIAAAKEAVVNKFEEIKSGIKNKIDTVKSNITSTFSAVKEAITKPINDAKEAVGKAVDKIKEKFDFKWKIPKPSIPKFSVSGGKAPWGFGGKGSLPKISINWNKLGGVFDMPTLFNYGGSLQGIGEDGAEAVVPLEKNTKWLDRLATMLNEKQGGNRPIILQVDGKTFAQVAVTSINDLTKQTGSLPLVIA